MIMKKEIFRGVATALITPFTADGTAVDYPKLESLINWQIESGINGLVICGTTGEASTLPDDEHKEVLKFSLDVAKGRVAMIAGTGSNQTDYAIELSKYACEIGYDAVLVVTPYYNKTTQNGLVKLFSTIADACTKPVILYNVPGRTGMTISTDAYTELAKHPNIYATKEASGDLSAILKASAHTADDFTIYSGNDDQILPILSVGGKGVISVLSNILPAETVAITDAWFAGNIEEATRLQIKYTPLINALFSEVNPIPVKAAAGIAGICENSVRLPLVTMSEGAEAVLLQEMRNVGMDV